MPPGSHPSESRSARPVAAASQSLSSSPRRACCIHRWVGDFVPGVESVRKRGCAVAVPSCTLFWALRRRPRASTPPACGSVVHVHERHTAGALLSPEGLQVVAVSREPKTWASRPPARGGPRRARRQHTLVSAPASSASGYLVDPASSHMLVSKTKPCMSKYKRFCTVKLRMAH